MSNESNQLSHLGDRDLSHPMVHYLLTIHKLKENKGYARVTDIARELGLTKGSVSISLAKLKKKCLVEEEEYSKFLNLTPDGHKEVHQILSSRTLLFYFLKDFIGVSEETAARDSCLMEHLVSSETSEKFFNFMKDLACHCESSQGLEKIAQKFETSLDLCQFKNADEFTEKQMGDGHLPEQLKW